MTLRSHSEELAAAVGRLEELQAVLDAAASAIAAAVKAGGKVMAAGNGGSAAEAQHLTGELTGRLAPDRERGPLPAVALHADTSSVTALANDYGYEHVFARQVDGLGRAGDVLVVLSTSGASPNLVEAVNAARAKDIVTVALLGPEHRALHDLCDHVLAVPCGSLQTVQECHLVLVHALVEAVEDALGAWGRSTQPTP